MLRSYHFLFILTATLIFLHYSDANIRKDCRRESKVSWAALKRMKSGDFNQDDPQLKCYLLCFLRKSGVLNKDASVDLQRALRYIPRSMHESSKELFRICEVPEMEPCERAYKMVKCYVTHKPEILSSVPFL